MLAAKAERVQIPWETFLKALKFFKKSIDKLIKVCYTYNVKRERLVNSQSAGASPQENFLKKVKKPLDKPLKV